MSHEALFQKSAVGGVRRWVGAALGALVLTLSALVLAPPGGTAGASTPASPAPAPAAVLVPPAGYWMLGGDGGVFTYSVPFWGSAAADATACPANPPGRDMPGGSCWSMAPTSGGSGYWILNAYSGQVFAFGDAGFYGQPAGTAAYPADAADLWPTAIAIVGTPDGRGYWVLEHGLSGLGSVQAFGDAVYYGDEVSTAATTGHNGYPVGMAATHDGRGYWIVDSDGGVFCFGDATFEGSMGGTALNAPIVAMARAPLGVGYWLVASDGGVFTFGDAAFGGSVAGLKLAAPIVGIAANPGGPGYWLAGADGGVFALGGAPFLGSMGGTTLSRPIFGITSMAA